ncbi:MAG: S8 family serine peptidase [Oscillospiraceae bacterium]|jgi:subtilisin family serine protease|nr:S8 family serine peptidase [Oscillospiraceae bacterium]
MKSTVRKLLSVLLAALLFAMAVFPMSISAANSDGISAAQYLKQLNALIARYPCKNAEPPNRITVKTNSNHSLSDTQGAVASVEGYNNWHVLQFETVAQTTAAVAYYKTKSYVQNVMQSNVAKLVSPIKVGVGEEWKEGEPLSWGTAKVGIDKLLTALADKDLPETIVAILDTGLDYKHPYIKSHADRIVRGANNSSRDGNGHGTHCAGIVLENSPPNVKVASYQVLNDWGSGEWLPVVAAIYTAVDDGADVVSMSMGGYNDYSDIYTLFVDAVNYANNNDCTVVVSSGNDFMNASDFLPAAVEEAVTVSASNKDNTLALFSNYGDVVDIAAPGGSASYSDQSDGINSSVPFNCIESQGTYYDRWQGTSMACPFVAAAAATLKSMRPAYAPADIQATLKQTSLRPAGWNTEEGGDGVLLVSAFENLPETPTEKTTSGVDRSQWDIWTWICYIFFFGWIWM